MDLNENELDIYCEQDDDGNWVARIYHRPSQSIKISNFYAIQQEAIDDAKKGLIELLEERRKGLGQN